MHIEHHVVVEAIDKLKKGGKATVSALASTLSVTRGWLYDNYRDEIKSLSKHRTDEDVMCAIMTIRVDKPFGRISIEDISNHLGISRQTFSRNHSHLIHHLESESPTFAHKTTEERLLARVKDLESQVQNLTKDQSIRLREREQQIFSQLMRNDVEHFETMRITSNLKKLQDQVDALSKLSKEKMQEAALLRIENSDLKNAAFSGGSKILNYIAPDYSDLNELKSPTLKEIHKHFNDAEARSIKLAEEVILETRPDYVIFFQPFFACNKESIPAIPVDGRLVIVESNVFNADIRSSFVRKIHDNKIIAVCAQTTLPKTKLYARGTHTPFGNEFITRVHESIQLPLIDDGFSAVIIFDPEKFR